MDLHKLGDIRGDVLDFSKNCAFLLFLTKPATEEVPVLDSRYLWGSVTMQSVE